MQVICSFYAYLRDGDAQNWRFVKLQEKMYKNLQSKMSSIFNLEKLYKDLNADMKPVKKLMASNTPTHKASLVIIVEVQKMHLVELLVFIKISTKKNPRKQPMLRNKLCDNNFRQHTIFK
jgi:hypothetical protein